ncbi:MAG: FAD-dependent oxidoreductase [Bacteroidota bacterium]
MKKIAVIGSGISGLSAARMLQKDNEVTVFEAADKPGGLVKCERVNDNLFHKVGGHVFNSRRKDVLDWFWAHFDRDNEFLKARRNAKILMDGKIIGYPLENYLFQLPAATVSSILDDMLALKDTAKKPEDYPNFEEFLRGNFGNALYELYFKPYNTKIWNTDLSAVPLEWLDGKLPMPNLKQMLMSNIVREEEGDMVHATFYYAKTNGSQFIVDRLSEGLNIKLSTPVTRIEETPDGLRLNGSDEVFDSVVFCGDVRRLCDIYADASETLKENLDAVSNLRSNGTSNLFCESDPTDISWLYLPGPEIQAHRIIYTGNFSPDNNRGSERLTCVVEFSGRHSYEFMVEQVKKLPGNLSPISYNYEPNSYVVQGKDTRDRIKAIKDEANEKGLYLLGRFAEWEYYNMDKAIEAAMEVTEKLNGKPVVTEA